MHIWACSSTLTDRREMAENEFQGGVQGLRWEPKWGAESVSVDPVSSGIRCHGKANAWGLKMPPGRGTGRFLVISSSMSFMASWRCRQTQTGYWMIICWSRKSKRTRFFKDAFLEKKQRAVTKEGWEFKGIFFLIIFVCLFCFLLRYSGHITLY